MDHRRALTALAATAAFAWSALGASPVCTGTIRDARGRPLVGVTVTIPGAGVAVTAADGTWRIDGVPTSDVLAVAEKAGVFRVRETVAAEPGADLRWDPTIGRPGEIKGRLVDEYGHALTGDATKQFGGWHVGAMPEPEWMRNEVLGAWGTCTGKDGGFTLSVDGATLHRLRVGGPDSWSRALLTGPMSDGLAEVVIRVPPSRMPHAHVRCRLEGPDGAPLTASWMTLFLAEGDVSGPVRFDAARAAWWSASLAPGRYSLLVHDPKWGIHDFGAVDVRDAADVDLGTLRMAALGRARLAAGSPGVADVRVIVRRAEPAELSWQPRWTWSIAAVVQLAETAATEFDLAPGRYRACLAPVRSEEELEWIETPFEVRSGETTTATVPLRAAPWRKLRLRVPGVLPSRLLATVSDADGNVVARAPAAGGQDVPVHLAPGRHSVVVETNDLRRLEGTFDVPAETAPERIDVPLR